MNDSPWQPKRKNEAFWEWFEADAKPKLGIRGSTFGLMLEHLDGFERPVLIIETGCCRRDPSIDESWKLDGCSTVLFARYLAMRQHGGRIESVDISSENTALCRANVRDYSPDGGACLELTTGDSVSVLKGTASRRQYYADKLKPDLLYLDSFDFEVSDPLPSQIHHHSELMAAMPMIRPDTLVVVDDAPAFIRDDQTAEIGGKGVIVARHMRLCGASLEFYNYHSGWFDVGPARQMDDSDVKVLIERARLLVERDRTVQAEHIYSLVLGLTTPPTSGIARIAHGEACAFYAKLALTRQKVGTASDWYREAIKADPLGSDYRLKLARQCLMPMGALAAALTEAERATKIDPKDPDGWHVLGGLHHEMGNIGDCIEAYETEIALDPNDPASLLDRAVIAIDTSDYDRVRQLCNVVLNTDRRPDALHCLAMVAAREHRHEEAIELAKQAIEEGCRDKPTTWWNMSISMHAIGRYKEGWEAHEKREGARSNPVLSLPMNRFNLPRWAGEGPFKEDGSPLKLHVHAEAGAGDNLAMVRYLPLLKARGYDVRYEAMESMTSLMRTSFPDINVMPRSIDYPGSLVLEWDPTRKFDMPDMHSPIGSIPAVLGTDIDTVPQNVPYVKPDPELVEHYRRLLRPYLKEGERKRVGLCWSSGIRPGVWMSEYGKRKSMDFKTLANDLLSPWYVGTSRLGPEKSKPPVFVSLQVGPERHQNEWQSQVIDLLPLKPTWEHTAALVANLDLVIAVDTATAHLAGAMGIPLWVMCQRDAASWHFLCWREGASWNERNPWYPSARVFRQATFDQPHKWDDVVADVARELRRFCAPAGKVKVSG